MQKIRLDVEHLDVETFAVSVLGQVVPVAPVGPGNPGTFTGYCCTFGDSCSGPVACVC